MGILKLFMPLLVLNMMLPGCSNGWIVGNIQLTPADSVINMVFIEIIAHDSTVHWYYGNISDYNYCYKHEQYEEVKVK
jgi:hypothetical protein